MSIATELTNYQTYLTNAYTKAQQKNATIPQNKNLQNLTATIDSLQANSVDSKDVDFIDYDGTILYSYTAQEFANLTQLPPNPSHPGLTAEGWNWTLADAKALVQKTGFMDIGQCYVTTDEKTHVYITLEEPLTILSYIYAEGSVTIDWGDGATETKTGTSATDVISFQHTYITAGNYCIKYTIDENGYALIKGTSNSQLISCDGSNNFDFYRGIIRKIEIGKRMGVMDYAFTNMHNLEAVTFPATDPSAQMLAGYKKLGTYSFAYDGKLKAVVIPPWITGLTTYVFSYSGVQKVSINKETTQASSYCFQYALSLKRIAMPTNTEWGTSMTGMFRYCRGIERIGLTKEYSSNNAVVGQYAFQYCQSLKKIKFPKDVSQISSNVFASCYSLAEIDFSDNTSVPSLGTATSITGSTPTSMKIIVPDNLYDTWITTSPWNTSGLVGRIIKKSQA